jgi:hypothetical protein
MHGIGNTGKELNTHHMKLDDYTSQYQNTGDKNDEIYLEFIKKTDTIAYLKEHRDYIQANKLGFGDRAFHYMWFLLLNKLSENKETLHMLEIGVYKGQVVSLWELISKNENITANVSAITPLEGKPPTKNKLVKFIRYVLSKEYRMDVRAGNFYENLDYIDIIKKLFAKFNLNFDKVDLNKGFSTDPEIIRKFSTAKVDLLYIDGDHSYEGALSDIINYSERINKGGYLVMDDASFYLPGSVFWKGYKSVADACEAIDKNTFVNVLNVAHNRVYQRI